MIYMINFF